MMDADLLVCNILYLLYELLRGELTILETIACLSMGAQGVWVGTRFVASFESKAPQRHVDAIVKHGSDETIRTTIYTGKNFGVVLILSVFFN